MNTENEAKLNYELSDYGKLLFEYNSHERKEAFYVSSEKRKANLKSPFFYYVVAMPFVLIVWFVASLVSVIWLEGDERWLRLGLALGSLVFIVPISVITLKLACGYWGKLYDWKIRGSLNKKESYLRIYEDYVVIKCKDETSVYLRSHITGVELNWNCFIRLKFRSYSKIFFLEIPPHQYSAERLERIFLDKLTIFSTRYAEPIVCNSVGSVLGGLAFVLLTIGIGVVVVCLNVYEDVPVPIFLGVMFIACGIMGACGSLSFIPFVKDIATPLAGAGMFVVVPWWLALTLHEVMGIAKGIKALLYLSPFTCMAVFLSSFGILFVASGVKAIMDYIRYGHKLGKL